MKKTKTILIIIIFLFSSQLFAAIHTSVPLNHSSYNIIEIAQIKGIISKQTDVRPYSALKVIRLLQEIIEHSESLTSGEIEQAKLLIEELHLLYGKAPSGTDELFSTGFLRFSNENNTIGTSLGINLHTQQTALLGTNEVDSRNSVVAFIKGDIGNSISFNMNFGLLFDRLNNRPFLDTEFTIPADGFYMQLTNGGAGLTSLPATEFFTGLAMRPEVAATFLDGAITLRYAGVERDWGVGLNNLLISKNARGFNGIEVDIDIASWLRYSVVTGSLTIFDLTDIDGDPFFSDELSDRPFYRFDNNISAHRIELDATKNLTISIFESVVWRKRFEIGYLNPVAIYMFEQNNLGDLDDVIAGLDFNLRLGNKMKVYGSVATSEMNSFSKIFTTPRNILAFQGGIVIPLKLGNFSTFTFQYTHLSPFFYSHYPFREKTLAMDISGNISPFGEEFVTTLRDTEVKYNDEVITFIDGIPVDFNGENKWLSPDGRIVIEKVLTNDGSAVDSGKYSIYETTNEAAYVHKGENLGYPLHPNSTEFLAQLDVMFSKGYKATASATYQARSGQYGFEIEQFMIYSQASNYPAKDFWNNIFNHRLTFELEGSKKFIDMPIEVYGSYRFTTEWKKDVLKETADGRDVPGGPNFGNWEGPLYDHVVSLGARIFL